VAAERKVDAERWWGVGFAVRGVVVGVSACGSVSTIGDGRVVEGGVEGWESLPVSALALALYVPSVSVVLRSRERELRVLLSAK
jgi:hypothetical protein